MDLAVSIAIGLTLLGSAVIALPNLVVEWAKRSSPEVVFSVGTERRMIALSIDDGPSGATAEILEVLDEYQAKATFFLIGEHVNQDPEMARRIVEAGHEVAHHMMEDRPSRELPEGVFQESFDEMDRIVTDLEGSRLFRPGSGWYDDQMIEFAEGRGYRTVLGSVYPFDAHLPWSGFHRWYVVQNAGPGSIIVLHEGPERGRRAAQTLRSILPELQRQGYQVVSVSTLLEG